MAKRILFIQRRSPYAGQLAYESLEAILMAGVFDQKVSVLFMDDGVFQLTQHDASQLDTRDVGKLCDALSMYDIDQLYVDSDSMADRGITQALVRASVELLPTNELGQFIRQHDVVVSS